MKQSPMKMIFVCACACVRACVYLVDTVRKSNPFWISVSLVWSISGHFINYTTTSTKTYLLFKIKQAICNVSTTPPPPEQVTSEMQSHVGSLSVKWRKSWLMVWYTHMMSQNGSTHGCVSTTFKCQFLTKPQIHWKNAESLFLFCSYQQNPWCFFFFRVTFEFCQGSFLLADTRTLHPELLVSTSLVLAIHSGWHSIKHFNEQICIRIGSCLGM